MGDHTEAIQLDFNPDIISYGELLEIFWGNHCPEFRAPSKQYASIIFYHNKEQEELAYRSKEKAERAKVLHTTIVPFDSFYMAEAYHQKYYLQLTREIMSELSKSYSDFRELVASTAAARINGYIKGYGDIEGFNRDKERLGLSERALKRLEAIVESYS